MTQPLHTFDETFADHRLTASEREALVWHLAMFRARKTIELLLPTTDTRIYGAKSDVRNNKSIRATTVT